MIFELCYIEAIKNGVTIRNQPSFHLYLQTIRLQMDIKKRGHLLGGNGLSLYISNRFVLERNYSAAGASVASASAAGASVAGASAAFFERRVRVAFFLVLAMFSS